MTTKINKAVVTIDLDDVVAAGGVAEAIFARCLDSDTYGSGYTQSSESQPTFAVQWREGLDITGYAARMIEGGALHYIDHSDGRMVSAVPVHEIDGEWYDADGGDVVDIDEVIHDFGGGHSVLGGWSSDSVVALECPEIEDAIEHPEAAAQMAREVMTHAACSDRTAWRELIIAIQAAGEAMSDIDADKLEG